MNVLDEKGKLICTVWAREVARREGDRRAQAKAGLKYSHIEETTVVGAVKFAEDVGGLPQAEDQARRVHPAAGMQPMDGDHMGTAPYNEFCLLFPAAEDKTAGPARTSKELHELSAKSTTASTPA